MGELYHARAVLRLHPAPRLHRRPQRYPPPVSKLKPPPRLCPCHSGRTYDACCAPYHRGLREPPDPTALMRSRYAAFALGEAEYLLRTLDAAHVDRALPRAELLRSLRGTRERLRYPSLVILDSRRTEGGGEVLFAAGVVERGKDQSFVELSDFAHDGAGWRYVSGILVPRAELGRAPEGLTIDAFLAIAGGY